MRHGLLTLALLFMAGCTSGPALPPTYPASGTVVYADGKPMNGGSVQFTSSADPQLRVVGTVDANGGFTLATLKDNRRADGAPEGEYKVTVFPPSLTDPRGGVAEGHKGVLPIALPKPYRIEAGTNSIRIELPSGPRKS
jgi:hypothetical protein